jgi:hypothetical protein
MVSNRTGVAIIAACFSSLGLAGCHRHVFVDVLRSPPTNAGKLGATVRGTLTTVEGVSDSAAYKQVFTYRIPSPGTFTATVESSSAPIQVDLSASAGKELLGSTQGQTAKRLVLEMKGPGEINVLVFEGWYGPTAARGPADFKLVATLTSP